MGFPIEINEKLGFGKYKNLTVLEVSHLNPGYLNWVLMNTDMLGPCNGSDFPFEEMKEHGYNPPEEVIAAYTDREDNFWANMEDRRREEYEQDIIDEIEKDFWDEMGETGYWNLD